MATPKITFVEGQGGLQRPPANNDHISALLFYNVSSLPSGFSSSSTATRCKALYSVDDAIAAGILRDYSDATSAAGLYTVTNAGAAGDTLELRVADINPATGAAQTTSLGIYTRTSAATTVTLVAADYVLLINSGTSVHGYTAANTAGAITITAHKRLGAFLVAANTPLSASIVGTIAGTITQQFATGSGGATAGVASKLIVYYYHISEFFRINPKGKLWVGFFGSPSANFSEVTDMQNNANGEIRQMGVFKDGTWAQADTTLLNTIAQTNKGLAQPLVITYAGNLQATTDITTISDMSSLSNINVSTCLGQDGAGWGNFIYKTYGAVIKSITCLGAQIGAHSLQPVSHSIGEGTLNLSSGVELETPAFCNGQLVSAISDTALDSIDSKRHTFLLRYRNYSGTYFNGGHQCVAVSSDYAYSENNRVIHKAERLLYASFIPYINSQIQINPSTGRLSDASVALFESVGQTALDSMVSDGDLSGAKITVNPAQNVLSSSKIKVAAALVINGTARNIEIPIGFKPSI